MEKMIKLICFDLDGTMLTDDKRTPEANIRAITQAAERGVHIVPASGRVHSGVPEAIRSLPFVRYFITSNGAQVYDAREDKILSKIEIDLELSLRFFRHAQSINCIYDCYKDDHGYISQSMWEVFDNYVTNPAMRTYIKSMRSPVPHLETYLEQTGGDIQKMQLYFTDMDERARQLEVLPRLFPELSFTSSMPFNIEVNTSACSKGSALKSLCEALGFDASCAMALGDGTNDLDMLKTAGLAVAMDNAVDSLKAAADYVTGSNNEAGFAQAVEKFVLI